MKIQKLSSLNIDRNGLADVVHIDPRFPVSLFLEELENYTNYAIPPHGHPQPEFIVPLSELEISTSDEVLHLAPGDCAFINAGQLHMISSASPAPPASAYILLFSPELIAPQNSLIHEKYMAPLLGDSRLPYAMFKAGQTESAPLLEALKNCLDAFEDESPVSEFKLRNRVCELWLKLFEAMDYVPLRLFSRQNRQSQFRLKQMLSFIRQNYVNHITLDDIAAAALVSKSECLRCFRSRFNMTPIQYLIECRLELGCHLLLSTDLNVKEIALRCGFEDAGYFGRVFRKHYGITP